MTNALRGSERGENFIHGAGKRDKAQAHTSVRTRIPAVERRTDNVVRRGVNARRFKSNGEGKEEKVANGTHEEENRCSVPQPQPAAQVSAPAELPLLLPLSLPPPSPSTSTRTTLNVLGRQFARSNARSLSSSRIPLLRNFRNSGGCECCRETGAKPANGMAEFMGQWSGVRRWFFSGRTRAGEPRFLRRREYERWSLNPSLVSRRNASSEEGLTRTISADYLGLCAVA